MATRSSVLGPKDSFNSRALVHGAAGEDFVAVEETLCYLVPGRLVLLDLIRRNVAFAAFFYADVSRKLDAFAEAVRPRGSRAFCGRVFVRRVSALQFLDGELDDRAGR